MAYHPHEGGQYGGQYGGQHGEQHGGQYGGQHGEAQAYGGEYDEQNYDGYSYENGGYDNGAYGNGAYDQGHGGQQRSQPPPQQRRPPPQSYDSYGRGRGQGAPRPDGHPPRGQPPGPRGPPPQQSQGYNQQYNSGLPYSPADPRGGQGNYRRPQAGPGNGQYGPPSHRGDPRHADRIDQHGSIPAEYPPHGQSSGDYGREGQRSSREQNTRRPGDRQHERQQRPKDRILETPISPQERPWDNPFPTFPTKKAVPSAQVKSHRDDQHADRPQSHESAHSRRHLGEHSEANRQHAGSGSSQSLPISHPGSHAQSNEGRRHDIDGGLDFGLPRPIMQVEGQRSNTMPDRGFPDLNPHQTHNDPPGPGHPNDGRSFSFEGPLSPPKPAFHNRRADSAGAIDRTDRNASIPQAYGDHDVHNSGQYEEVFDDYAGDHHAHGEQWSPGEEMPNFDAPATVPTTEFNSLHIGGQPRHGPDGSRGSYEYDEVAPNNTSQPNYGQPAMQGSSTEFRSPPPGRGAGYQNPGTWASSTGGPNTYGTPAPQNTPRGPPRGPLPQFKPRPQPGQAQGQQRPTPPGAGRTPPNPQNPDALPSHPAPVRPGLMQQLPGPRPVQAQHRQQAPPMSISRAETMQQPVSASAPPPAKPAPVPVTIDDIRNLRQHVMNQPGDQATTLELAKKLVEAASTLIGDKGRVDPKTRAKNRDKFLGEAYKHLKKLASYNYPDAMFFLADCYGRDVGGRGLFGPLPDQKEAFVLYQAAAKANHPQAAYRVAVCCEMGQDEGGGTRRDPLKALQWYRRAAALGDPPAMYKMGIILLKGLLGQQPNPAEAIGYLQQAAERADADNPHALHELGLLYESGSATDGVPCDDNYSRQLFVQAAQLGYKFSQYKLGSAFEYGSLGCPVDPRQSIAWYSKAAIQEEHQSELALSGWYLTGSEGVIQQSDTEAYLWARKAAQAGLSKAEYAMGYFTEVGIGAPADLESAKRWYWRAASQNYPKARERLEDLRKGGARMQKSQVSRSDVKNSQGECSVM